MSIILWSVLLSLNFAQQNGVGVFRIVPDQNTQTLDLDALVKITDNQPAFVTVMVKLEEGKKINCSWMPFHPHASNNDSHDFYKEVEQVINSWTYDETIKGNGEIYYTVSIIRNISRGLEGLVTIDLKSFSLPNYEKYAFPSAESAGDLVVTNPKGFQSKNVKMIMKKAQMPGSLEKSWLEKLTYTYVVVFVILLLLFIFFTGYTIHTIRHNRNYPKKSKNDYQNRIKELWIDSQLSVYFHNEMHSLDINNPDQTEEIDFINELVSIKLYEKKADNAKKYGDNAPNINYDELKLKLSECIKSDLALKKAQSVIWRYYTEPFIQKAKELCKKAEIENLKSKKDSNETSDNSATAEEIRPGIRLNKIFLAGLENHLNNKTAFYTSSEIDRAIEKTAGSELEQMKGMMDGIWFIASVAPMIGLFGTVTGISKSFAQISAGGLEQSELITRLAGGINEALYTTIAGLIIGMLATFTYYFAKTIIDNISAHWEELFIEITNRF